MSKPNATPGEWFVLREGIELPGAEAHEIGTLIDDCPITIAQVFISGEYSVDGDEPADYEVSKEESLANLHLLAAAKDLRDELKAAHSLLDALRAHVSVEHLAKALGKDLRAVADDAGVFRHQERAAVIARSEGVL